jgi:hypothetical protein
MLLVRVLHRFVIADEPSQLTSRTLEVARIHHDQTLVPGGDDPDFPADYSNLIPEILEFLGTTWKD